jgi:hypothetical protein
MSRFVNLSYFEFDMRVLGFCKVMGRSRNAICAALTGSVGHHGLVSGRVDGLVKRGLLSEFKFGKKALNGCFKHVPVSMFVITDEGSQALFFYEQSLRFYNPEKVLEVKA